MAVIWSNPGTQRHNTDPSGEVRDSRKVAVYSEFFQMFGSHVNHLVFHSCILKCYFIFRNSTDHQKILDEANGKHKMVIDKLNEERAMLEVCLANINYV